MSWFVRNEDLRTYVRKFPVTSLFIFINIAVFLVMTLAGGTTNQQVLFAFGAYYKPAVLAGDWYRLITPVFLHIGWEHLLFNCFSIYIFAPGLEALLGKLRYLVLYIGTGVAGFLATFLFASPGVLAAGASGAIFGLYGMYAFLLQYRRGWMDRQSRQIIVPIVVFGIISTFVIPGISITGHMGGLISGFLAGYLLAWKK